MRGPAQGTASGYPIRGIGGVVRTRSDRWRVSWTTKRTRRVVGGLPDDVRFAMSGALRGPAPRVWVRIRLDPHRSRPPPHRCRRVPDTARDGRPCNGRVARAHRAGCAQRDRQGPGSPGGPGGRDPRRGQPAHRHLLGVLLRDPPALPHRVARALDGRLRLHGRALPGRQRPGPDGRRLGLRPQRPSEVGGLRRIRHLVRGPRRTAARCWPRRDHRGHHRRPDRQGAAHRSAGRDDLGRQRPRSRRPRIRCAPRDGHNRRRARPRARLRHSLAGSGRVPPGARRVVRCGAAGCRTARAAGARPAPAARPARSAARAGFSWRSVSTPGLVRLLVVAGLLGLVTIGDGFLYLALLDRAGSPPSSSRCSTSAPASATWPWLRSAGWPTGSAGPRSWWAGMSH